MNNKKTLLVSQLTALIEHESDAVANMANAAALLFQSMNDISWAGFYRYQKASDELVLGPFQGKVACIHIKNGSGVCGTALQTQQTQRVVDVRQFSGHIACDADSRSEIVVPINLPNGEPFGVLDIDAPIVGRFSQADEEMLTAFANAFAANLTSH